MIIFWDLTALIMFLVLLLLEISVVFLFCFVLVCFDLCCVNWEKAVAEWLGVFLACRKARPRFNPWHLQVVLG